MFVEACDDLRRVRVRQRAVLPEEGTLLRNDVERGPALDRADIYRRVRRTEAAGRVSPLAHFFGKLHQEGDQLRRVLNGADAEMRLARVEFEAGHRRLVGLDTLVGVDDLHGRGLAHDHDPGLRQVTDDALDHRPDAEATDFLVIGKREVDRYFRSAFQEFRHEGEGNGDEALHVVGAAAEEPAVLLDDAEGIARPVLALDRYDIGVSRQNDAACLRFVAQRREEVRLGAVLVHHAP